MKNVATLLMLAALTQAACFYRCGAGDTYACQGTLECWAINPSTVCLEGRCVDPLALQAEAGTGAFGNTSSSSGNPGSSTSSSGSSGSSSGEAPDAGELPPLESCTPVHGCEDGGCPFAVQVVAGGGGTCARFVDGTVQCWGSDNQGSLGQGGTDRSDRPSASPMRDVAGNPIHDVVSLSKSEAATYVGLDGGRVAMAGERPQGSQSKWVFVEDAGPNPFSTPATRTLVVENVIHMAGGKLSLCVNTTSGTECRGQESSGRLGTNLPAVVGALASAEEFTLAIAAEGVRGWGSNWNAQLGVPGIEQGDGDVWQAEPSVVPDTQGAVSVAAGGSDFACAVTVDQRVLCWGKADDFLGHPNSTANLSYVPLPVKDVVGNDFNGAVQVSAGYEHACAVRVDGSVWCWGTYHYGNLGENAASLDQDHAVRVTNLGSWVQVTSGSYHNCAVNSCGQVFCWGRNDNYQLADTTVGETGRTPLRIVFPHL